MCTQRQKFQGDCWLAYDNNFRKFKAQNRSAKWTEIHGSFWSLAFSTQKPNEHCTMCFSLDHPTTSCPDYTKASDSNSYPTCRRWNFGNCDITTCQYKHQCLDCGEDHKVHVCPKTTKSTCHMTDRITRRVNVMSFDHADKSFKADDSMHNAPDSEFELCRLDISDQDHLVDRNTILNLPGSHFLADPSYALTPKFSPVTIETLRNSTYPYTSDLLSIDNCKPPESTPGIAIEGSTSINTPLIDSAWRTALSHHPD